MRKRVKHSVSVQTGVTVTIVRFPRGGGTERDPVRKVTQVFDSEDRLIAEHDPVTAEFLAEHYYEVP